MKLKDICSIKTGLVLSRKISDDTSNAYKYKQITLKSVNPDGSVNSEDFNDFYSDEVIQDKYIAIKGDVLVRLTAPFNAIYVDDLIDGVVVPSHFVIIRTDNSMVYPKYVEWYLNRDKIKKSMLSSCAGALFQIKPTTIAEMQINLPPLLTQKKVMEINELAQREINLYNNLIEQKQLYYKQLTRQINKTK